MRLNRLLRLTVVAVVAISCTLPVAYAEQKRRRNSVFQLSRGSKRIKSCFQPVSTVSIDVTNG